MDKEQENDLVLNTRIQQKINAAHRGAFRDKFPGQVEHVLRLIAERLQTGLNKNSQDTLDNHEVAALSSAMVAIYEIYREQNPPL